MSLTKCPDCHRLSFANADSCPTCERIFRPGELSAQAGTEARNFLRVGNSVFAVLVLAGVVAVALLMLRGA